ncbi:protein SRC2-like [Salvia splendens]|nr:protein SRC2-like [Salvia splendens]
MGYRKFQITLVSAENLPNVRSFGQMKVYAEVSINGDPKTSKRTTVNTDGETNPRWNFSLDYTIEEASLKNLGLVVVVKLYCERTLGDRYIGEVKISVKGLFDSGSRSENELSYNVAGAGDGKLNILYSFGSMFEAPKSSVWKKVLEVGLAVMIEGVVFLLTGDIGDL